MQKSLLLSMLMPFISYSFAFGQVKEVSETMVKKCESLGQVSGESKMGGLSDKTVALKKAQDQAREKAKEIGASHLVWGKTEEDYFGAKASATAYNCIPLNVKKK